MIHTSKPSLNMDELSYLVDVYRFTINCHSSSSDPISQALYALINAVDITKYAKSKTLIAIYDHFRLELDILPWHTFFSHAFNKASVKSQTEWVRKLNDWRDDEILDLAEEMILKSEKQVNIDKMSRQSLIKFLSEAIIEDRPIQLYFEKFKKSYEAILVKAMEKFMQISDKDTFAWFNYEDGIDSHCICTSAKHLETITEGDVFEISNILDGKHTHITFKGKKSEFSNSVKLFLKLR